MTRKYGMTIKLAERGNERVLKVSLTERQEIVKFKEFRATDPCLLVPGTVSRCLRQSRLILTNMFAICKCLPF